VHKPTKEQDEIFEMIKSTLREVARTESAECRLCGHVVRGTSFGEILQRLGVHGDRAHPGHWLPENSEETEETD